MQLNHTLTLNHAMVDWLTITSFDHAFFAFWDEKIRKGTKSFSEKNIPRYRGVLSNIANGHVSAFVGNQNGRTHYMVHLAGEIANEYFEVATQAIRQGIAKCTRIDLQITSLLPDDWNQFSLLGRLKKMGRSVGWYESKDRDGAELSTVYIGSRKSDRFIRLYIKPLKGDRNGLRFEVQMNGERAQSCCRALMDRQDDFRAVKSGMLLERIHHCNDARMAAIFEPMLGKEAIAVKVKIVKNDNTTVEWLLFQCLPVLERILSSHDNPDSIARHYQSALNRHKIRMQNEPIKSTKKNEN